MATSDGEVRAALRAGVMRFAQGITETQADEVLDVICKGWGFRDCAQLAEVVPLLEVPGQVGTNGILFFLHAFVLVGNHNAPARRMIQQAARTLALLDREQAAPSN